MPFYQINNSPYTSYYEIIYYEDISFSSHFHQNFEFIVLLDGKLKVFDEEKKYNLISGDTLLVFPNHIHSFDRCDNIKCYICSFSTDYVPAFMNSIKDKSIKDAVFRPDNELMNFLLYQFKKKFTLSPLEIKALSYVICSSFINHATFCDKENANATLLHKILNYILNNYRSDISLKNLANELNYEEHYLSRCFHKSFPFNFKNYINQLRINDAKSLLQGTKLSITEISSLCGFNSIRNFNRMFIKECGVSPTAYRKLLK